MRKTNFLIIILILFSLSCSQSPVLKIASKYDAENMLFAEIIAIMAEEKGIRVERIIPYGNTFDCLEGIKNTEFHLYPEYTGTVLSLLGVQKINDSENVIKKINEMFMPSGIECMKKFGVNNKYVLAINKKDSVKYGIKKISELGKLEKNLRFGFSEEFKSRPLDGYSALLRHYGFSDMISPLINDNKDDLYKCLFQEKFNVIIAYSTDSQIEHFGLQLLEDDFNFFLNIASMSFPCSGVILS